MKVVLFCGGLGLRIRDAENVPKPLVTIGHRPILWHVMKYYTHFGHKDFILCLGYRGNPVKQYFLNDTSACRRLHVVGGRQEAGTDGPVLQPHQECTFESIQ
jgi:glucose-1-phosphate cytidylyltransferase